MNKEGGKRKDDWNRQSRTENGPRVKKEHGQFEVERGEA